jgi:hypothetical protein
MMSVLNPRTWSLRQGSLALAGLLAAALAAQAADAVLDDFEGGTNQNKFLGYSYFYGDASDGGTSTVTSGVKGTDPNGWDVTAASFDPAGNGGSAKALKMSFTYGANKPQCKPAPCSYGQQVGYGTQFVGGTDDGKVIDLTGATSISFYAKASAAMAMRVEFATKPVTNFAFHRSSVSVTTAWTKFTIFLDPNNPLAVQQPTWNTVLVPLDVTQAQKLQFSVSADDNASLLPATPYTVWLDDITVEGYTWNPPAACIPCVGTAPATGAVLSDLEIDNTTTPPRAANQNAAGGYWFVYNDVGARAVTTQAEYSEIFEGVTNTDPKLPLLNITAGKGAGASAAAYIKFQLGPTYVEGANTVMPFVGVGTKTSDPLGVSTMDATGSTGIAFDYWTDPASTFKFLRLEAYTNQTDLGTNLGAVHSVLVPVTAGTWKTAIIPWAKFSLPDWKEIPNKLTPVKITGLVKFQWVVQDAPKTAGAFAIDNVKLPGMTVIPPLSIRSSAQHAAKGLRMLQGNGRLDVAYLMPSGVTDASISLVDMAGAKMAGATLSGKGELHASLDTRNLRSGVYSLQLRHSGVVRALPVTLLK